MVCRHYILNIVFAAILIMKLASAIPDGYGSNTTPAGDGSKRNIFKPPSETDVTDIKNNPTPWILDEYVPKIREFRDNVIKGLETSSTVKKYLDNATDSKASRTIFFKLANKLFFDHKHPVPPAFANIVSKAASLFDSLSSKKYFEAVAYSSAEFLLSEGKEADSDTASKYVSSIENAIQSGDTSTSESLLLCYLSGYANYFTSLGFDVDVNINKLDLLFTNQLIILHDM